MPELVAPLLGLLVGLVLGGLGAGGSVLAIPALVHGAGLAFPAAATASLVVVGTASTGGALREWREGNVALRTGFAFGGAGAIGAVAGTWLGERLSEGWLQTSFAVLVLAVAVRMLAGDLPETDEEVPPCRCWRIAALGVVVGSLTGLFGVGGGFVIVPVLVLVVGLPMPLAIGTSLVVITLNAAVALVARAPRLPDLPWPVVAGFALAALVGVAVGARLADRLEGQRLQHAFALLLVALALWTGWQGVQQLT